MIVIREPSSDRIVTVIADDAVIAEPDPITVTQTLEGDPGLSAYAVAVLNGFAGSQSAWLASLQGPPGDSVVDDPGDLTLIFNNGLV